MRKERIKVGSEVVEVSEDCLNASCPYIGFNVRTVTRIKRTLLGGNIGASSPDEYYYVAMLKGKRLGICTSCLGIVL
jgi:hypothetical protein